MGVESLYRRRLLAGALAIGALSAGGIALRDLKASDHQQTAYTELNPRLDVTDVWAFPGSSDDRIVVAMTLGSPILGDRFAAVSGNQLATFDPNALYQIKVDNNQDGVADVVLQFSFDQMKDGSQNVDVIGPVAPRDVGIIGSGERDAFLGSTPVISAGATNSTLTGNLAAGEGSTAGQIQVFAGLRDDPFYIDLEQFFRIVPDRRPTQGALSHIGGVIPAQPGTVASAFRPTCTDGTPNSNQTQFAAQFGCAVDFLAGFNALAIVVELPESQLTQGRGNGQLGIWASTSH